MGALRATLGNRVRGFDGELAVGTSRGDMGISEEDACGERAAVTIRRLAHDDVAAGAQVIRQAFWTVAEAFGLTEENCPTNGAFLRDEALAGELDRGTALYGLFDAGGMAGFVALKRKDDVVFYLEKLAVLPERRGRGYGAALVGYAAEAARKAGGGMLSIGVMYENRRLVRWYERNGFARTGTRTFGHLPFVVCCMVRSLEASPRP